MVSEVISKAGKPNIKVNAKYYSNALLKKIFLKWTDRQNIMSIYSCKTELELTQPSPSLKCWITRNNFHYRSHIICLWINYIWETTGFGIWGLLEQHVNQGQRITNLGFLKELLLKNGIKFHQKALINVLTHLKHDFDV